MGVVRTHRLFEAVAVAVAGTIEADFGMSMPCQAVVAVGGMHAAVAVPGMAGSGSGNLAGVAVAVPGMAGSGSGNLAGVDVVDNLAGAEVNLA